MRIHNKAVTYYCTVSIMLRVPYSALDEATGGFLATELLGQGSFAAVYRGKLPADRHGDIMSGTGSVCGQEEAHKQLRSGYVAIKLLFQRPAAQVPRKSANSTGRPRRRSSA